MIGLWQEDGSTQFCKRAIQGVIGPVMSDSSTAGVPKPDCLLHSDTDVHVHIITIKKYQHFSGIIHVLPSMVIVSSTFNI